ncbi:hypothetical protein BZG36_02849 [Bifiguratus adelaidae]|uniref:Mitochondrial import inner membrane translocase subunit TIM23 n=1 Tax=Bifiguratus adelaidae TaxID=1938954 RepID=A0A261Y0L4_9FUNG|nr:hypothetical protein BZG36_02849 [Bifiguratus adelaidae]
MSFIPDNQTTVTDDQYTPQYDNVDSAKVSDFLNDLTFDPVKLHPMAVQGGIDFLQIEDQASTALPGSGRSALPSRGWSDDLCYGTGTTYLAGLTIGGAWGMAEGLRRGASSPNLKLKLNTFLNSTTRRGPLVGNSVGVIAMMYNATNSMVGHFRGHHDPLNSAVAGAISGAIFKSTAGIKTMGTSAALCAALATAWSVGKEYVL